MGAQYNLTTNDKNVLLALDELSSSATPQELAKESLLKIETAMQSAYLLTEMELASVDEELIETYMLAAEGIEYAKDGLPERQIIDAISEPTSIDDLKQRLSPKMVGILSNENLCPNMRKNTGLSLSQMQEKHWWLRESLLRKRLPRSHLNC
jgi:hypothetical protein